jgi:hypothetical protein
MLRFSCFPSAVLLRAAARRTLAALQGNIRSRSARGNTKKRRVAQKLHLKFAPSAGSMLMRIGRESRGESREGKEDTAELEKRPWC